MNRNKHPKICLNCGVDFLAQKITGKFCSLSCAYSDIKGKKRPDEYMKGWKDGFTAWKTKNPELAREISINNLPKDCKKENNGNWRDGATEKTNNLRLIDYGLYTKWRKSIFDRCGDKCIDCGATTKLESHHIVAISELPEARFESWNGVILCRTCHSKTYSFGGCDKATKSKMEKFLEIFSDESLPNITIRTIPHKWQEYDTAGNYFSVGGVWVVFISQLKDWRYEACILIHELVEMFLTRHHGVKWTDIDTFDKEGLGKNIDDPGALWEAPYHNEHKLAEQMEKRLAKMLGVDWEEYNKELDSLEYKNA